MLSPQKIKSALETNFSVVRDRSTTEEMTILCGLCGDQSGNRAVSLRSGLTNCWRCGNGSSLKAYARKVGVELDLDDNNPAIKSETLEEDLRALDLQDGPRGEDRPVELPWNFHPFTPNGDGRYHKLAAMMARRKKLDLSDFIEAKAGYAPRNSYWCNYAIFPVIEWGRVVYYQGRTYIDPPDSPTKQFPSKKILPLGSRYWVYNIDELRARGGTAVVVESIFNVLSLRREFARQKITGYIPIAVFKHKLSREQIEKIGRISGLRELIFLYDVDATADAHAEAAKMRVKTKKTTVAEMPEGDPNDDAELAVEAIMNRRKPDSLRPDSLRLDL